MCYTCARAIGRGISESEFAPLPNVRHILYVHSRLRWTLGSGTWSDALNRPSCFCRPIPLCIRSPTHSLLFHLSSAFMTYHTMECPYFYTASSRGCQRRVTVPPSCTKAGALSASNFWTMLYAEISWTRKNVNAVWKIHYIINITLDYCTLCTDKLIKMLWSRAPKWEARPYGICRRAPSGLASQVTRTESVKYSFTRSRTTWKGYS
jgi:hypothetical protein